MIRKSPLLALTLCMWAVAISGVAASTAAADTVTAGNQIFSGNACFGGACSNPESYGPAPLRAKTTDTPAVSLV